MKGQIARNLSAYADEVLTLARKTGWNALARIVEALLGVKRWGGGGDYLSRQ